MDDADVGERRLGEHERDVARGELALERVDVVELDDARRLARVARAGRGCRARGYDPPSTSVANVSSTVPW